MADGLLHFYVNLLLVHPITDSPEEKDDAKGKQEGAVLWPARKPGTKPGKPMPGIGISGSTFCIDARWPANEP